MLSPQFLEFWEKKYLGGFHENSKTKISLFLNLSFTSESRLTQHRFLQSISTFLIMDTHTRCIKRCEVECCKRKTQIKKQGEPAAASSKWLVLASEKKKKTWAFFKDTIILDFPADGCHPMWDFPLVRGGTNPKNFWPGRFKVPFVITNHPTFFFFTKITVWPPPPGVWKYRTPFIWQKMKILLEGHLIA